MPLYRHDNKIVFFVHIPKTGGTTVETALKQAGAVEALKFKSKNPYSKATLQHMHAEVYRLAVDRSFHDWCFTVVRNPYARFASEYKMKVVDAEDDTETSVADWAIQNFERFREFSYTRDNHIRPQVQFTSKRTTVFRFEEGLDAPIAKACEVLGLDVPEIPHAKKGSAGRPKVSERGIEAIRHFYRRDFKKFGYDPDSFESAFEVVD